MTHHEQGPAHRVLVMDNNRDCADSMGALLRLMCDWDVDVAYGCREGVSLALQAPPDAVIMDLELGDGSGFEAADRMQGALPGHGPHLVAVTGNSDLCEEAAHDKRFARSLLKPADASQLVRLLNGFSERLEPPSS
jgi:two-component system, sensor histidine kinase